MKMELKRLIEENAELKRDLHELRCRHGDLADLVGEVALDFEAGQELAFLVELVKLYRKQQEQRP
jgi:hypothetical protein